MKTASPADLAEIDNFCDALWLEDGLAKATLDLSLIHISEPTRPY